MKFVVIVPTYNESGNIEKLIRTIVVETQSVTGHTFDILVVDGFSPDGTGDVVKNLQKEFKNLFLIEKEKEGLGADYAYAMKHAMEKMGAEAIVEMDADFQHDPGDLPRFAVQIDGGYDYVLGSRFVKGGSIPDDWQFHRKALSVLGNFASRLILGLPNISDYTTGYKASRVRGFLDQIDLDHLESKGFAYKINLLSQMMTLGAKVKEIPIKFFNREKGVSKMEGNNWLETLRVIVKIRIKKNQKFIIRFIKYLTVGFLGLIMDFIGYALLVRWFGWTPFLSSIISGQSAIISNFFWNNHWTYADRKHRSLVVFVRGLIIFVLASNFGVTVVRGSVIYALTNLWGQGSYVFYYFAGTSFLVIYNFTIYSKVIWRRKI